MPKKADIGKLGIIQFGRHSKYNDSNPMIFGQTGQKLSKNVKLRLLKYLNDLVTVITWEKPTNHQKRLTAARKCCNTCS